MTPVSSAAGSRLWQPYADGPAARVWCDGEYRPEPQWFRHFVYPAERARGLDDREDLAAPGVFVCAISADAPAVLLFGEENPGADLPPAVPADASAADLLPALRAEELSRRERFPTLLERSADDYLVRGGRGLTVIAGYPWFTDWGRDTFIALRGLCLATGRFEEAREILLQWTNAVSEGMLPNRFPDGGQAPEYNSADASLWFIVAAHDYLAAAPRPAGAAGLERFAADQSRLLSAAEAILTGYAAGTRFGIRADPADGLLRAGQPGVALTWMDAVYQGRAFTARIGKPVEIQALWLNALWLMAANSPRWRALYEQALPMFQSKFWNDARGCLYDVIDCDGQPGKMDERLRPNQIFAVGGLPLTLLPLERARLTVETVQRELLTPMGLRTLARSEPGYCPFYGGDGHARDAAYHQGTAWPWLLGPFVEGWVRVHGDTQTARARARARFVEPLLATMPAALGLNHVAEIADAEPPHASKGCPFQAWSVGELARLVFCVLK